MTTPHSSKRIRPDQLTVDANAKPDWLSGSTRPPAIGEVVYCAAGMAQVIKLLGKTSEGCRILELKLVDLVAPPFFASCANVLVPPQTA